MRALALPLAALPALTGACLLEDDGPPEPQPPQVTSGAYHHYAQRSFMLPMGVVEADTMGFDLDDDGYVDNQGGRVIGALASLGLDVQLASDEALTNGTLVILHSVRADDLRWDDSVSWRVMAGEPTATPPSWDGTDVFDFAGDDGSLAGELRGGIGRMEWGTINVPLPFFPGQSPTILPLTEAHIRVDITDTGCEGRMGGAMLADDITITLRRFAAQAITHIESHPDDSFARSAIQIFDVNRDGVITVDEMLDQDWVQQIFDPDMDLDGNRVDDALSFGFGFSCEQAQFVVPGEI